MAALETTLELLKSRLRLSAEELLRQGVVTPAGLPALLAELEALGVARRDDRFDVSEIDFLDPAEIRGALSSASAAWLERLDVLTVAGSTQEAVLAARQAGSVDGIAVLAELQVAGRGRRGRAWLSPFGRNLALSVGVRLERPLAGAGCLSLVVGLAVVDVLEGLGATGLALKWPNDVLLGDAKLAGILIETAASGTTDLIVGIGVNVGAGRDLEHRVGQPVADLREAVPSICRSRLAGRLIDAVHLFAGRFDELGFAPFREAWQTLHRHQGRAVRVTAGDRIVEGVALGVDDHGALTLETAAGIEHLSGGEVSVRAAPP